jgi:hypothetical protein
MAAMAGLLCARPSVAQSRTPYFHEAAQQYLDARFEQALATVNRGLRAAPGNPRLEALREKIQQERRRQQSSSGSGGAPQQSQRGGQPPQNAGQQDGDSREQSTPEPGDRSDQSSTEQGRPEESSGAGSASANEASEPSDPGQASGTARQGQEQGPGLSRAQAARILRALEMQEKQLLRQVQKRQRLPQRIVKEW